MVAIFANVCLCRRSLWSNLAGTDLEKLYRVEPLSYAITAYVVASYGPRFFSTVLKIFGVLARIFCQMVYRPPPPANNFPCAYGRRRSRKKWKRSDSSDSDSVALTTPIFYFYYVISALTASLTTPTPSLVTFPLVVPRATVGNYVCVCGQVMVIPSTTIQMKPLSQKFCFLGL